MTARPGWRETFLERVFPSLVWPCHGMWPFHLQRKVRTGLFPQFPRWRTPGRAFYRPVIGMARKQQSFPAARSWFPPPFPELPADREGRMGGTSPAWKSRKYGNREKRRGGSQRGEGHSYCFFWGIRHSQWLFHPRSTLRIRPFIWFSHWRTQ